LARERAGGEAELTMASGAAKLTRAGRAPGLTYKEAGVDASAAQSLVPRFRRLARRTIGAHVLEGIGGFGCAVRLPGGRRMRAPVIVAGTDGVGTKLKLAFATGRHDTVGIDCVAMCVNDVICSGARPLFFLDYIGVGKLDEKVVLDIVAGVARGCEMAGVSLVGGETAEMPGLYADGEYDLVGFAVGVADRGQLLSPNRMRAGDALIGLASSGLHSNGFALARQALLQRAGLKLDAVIPELGCPLGDEMMRPTTVYARAIEGLRRRFPVKGLAHITGGGIAENLPRVLPPGLRARLRRGSWPTPPIFSLIARAGAVSAEEMDRTFNNGVGMVAVMNKGYAQTALEFLRRQRQPAYLIGRLERGPRGVIFE
jgi:phosphoribosylformylglycinamidine cyclo-ligase